MLAAVAAAREPPAGTRPCSSATSCPIWVTRRALENRHLWHDPRKRQCSVASLTSPALRGRHASSASATASPPRDLLPGASTGRGGLSVPAVEPRRASRCALARRARRRCSPAARPTAPAGGTDDVAEPGLRVRRRSARRPGRAADRTGPVELAGTDFAGAAQDVADWRGDVVVLNTWYAAARRAAPRRPTSSRSPTDYADDGVHVLGHQLDRRRRRRAGVRAPVRGPVPEPRTTPTAPRSRRCRASSRCRPCRRPSCSTATGKVAARILGLADPSTLRSLVDDLLAEAAPTTVMLADVGRRRSARPSSPGRCCWPSRSRCSPGSCRSRRRACCRSCPATSGTSAGWPASRPDASAVSAEGDTLGPRPRPARSRVLLGVALFVAGFTVVFVALGVLAGSLGGRARASGRT